ncbi:3639_t:CDS:2, partial [Gigaspora margarita]
MPSNITVLCYITDYRYSVVKYFQIQDSLEEFNLARFEEGDVVIAT